MLQEQVKYKTAAEIGELVCCKAIVGGHEDIYRGKVLQVFPTQDEVMLELFAVDYGINTVVSLDCVSRITPRGRQEPFQVTRTGIIMVYTRRFK